MTMSLDKSLSSKTPIYRKEAFVTVLICGSLCGYIHVNTFMVKSITCKPLWLSLLKVRVILAIL